MSNKIIAIDYDGTIATGTYPEAGEPNWMVINKAKAEKEAGATLILWTCRDGAELTIAIEACAEWGLSFDAINDNPPSRQAIWGNNPRKIYADEYWDDHAKEVRYGHWDWYSGTMMECSVCKRHTARHRFKYCPHCGAKMDGGNTVNV